MSQLNIASHQEIVHFPKDGKPSLSENQWQIWSGSHDEGGLPDLEHGAHKVLVPFTWWLEHHHEEDVIANQYSKKLCECVSCINKHSLHHLSI